MSVLHAIAVCLLPEHGVTEKDSQALLSDYHQGSVPRWPLASPHFQCNALPAAVSMAVLPEGNSCMEG